MEFAGSWYPARSRACAEQIERFWESLAPTGSPAPAAPPRSHLGVVPHAGWVFSGRLAARVFQLLEGDASVELVIVLGGHLGPDDPLVAMCEGEWDTPFGAFAIHRGFEDELRKFPKLLLETESRNHPDNSTELQLPFAKYRFPNAELLPIRVPPGPAARELGRRLAAYLESTGLRAVAVASTDLTHYGPNYSFEPKGRGEAALRWVNEVNDPAFIEAVASGEGEAILDVAARRRNACSAGAVAALNELALAAELRFSAIGHLTSADGPHGDTSNFVSYLGGVYG